MPNPPKVVYRPSLLRYLAVILYDTLLLLSVLLFASAISVALNGGQAVGQGNLFFTLYLFAVSFLFYGWFWTHGGQTLGMRSWKVTLHSTETKTISWQQAFLRFVVALVSWLPLGLGFWWGYLSAVNNSWPNMLSNTYLHYDENQKARPLSPLSE